MNCVQLFKSVEESRLKFVPVQDRLNPVSDGRVRVKVGRLTWNDAVLVVLPWGVTMVIGPEVASGGTTVVMRRSRLFVSALVKVAEAPLKRMAVAPVKFVPVRVTFPPGAAVDGENWEPVKPG